MMDLDTIQMMGHFIYLQLHRCTDGGKTRHGQQSGARRSARRGSDGNGAGGGGEAGSLKTALPTSEAATDERRGSREEDNERPREPSD